MILAKHSLAENYLKAETFKDIKFRNNIIFCEIARAVVCQRDKVLLIMRRNGINAKQGFSDEKITMLLLRSLPDNEKMRTDLSEVINHEITSQSFSNAIGEMKKEKINTDLFKDEKDHSKITYMMADGMKSAIESDPESNNKVLSRVKAHLMPDRVIPINIKTITITVAGIIGIIGLTVLITKKIVLRNTSNVNGNTATSPVSNNPNASAPQASPQAGAEGGEQTEDLYL